MSKVRRFDSPDAALAALALRVGEGECPWVRLRIAGGAFLEGRATSVNAGEISVSPSSAVAAHRVTFDAIQRLEMRHPSRWREWATAAVLAALAVAALVGASRTPVLERLAELDVFMLLYVLAAAAAPFVLARTSLGRWLRPWHVLYAASPARGA